MAALLVGDAEVAAGLAPLGAVWRDPPAAAPGVRDQMGELVPQGAIDLRFAMLPEEGIQADDISVILRAPCRRSESAAPDYTHIVQSALAR